MGHIPQSASSKISLPRRNFLQGLAAGAAGAVVAAGPLITSAWGQAAAKPAAPAPPMGPFKLPPLAYDYGALEPHIDEQTMKIHHDKHHQAYINNLNTAV